MHEKSKLDELTNEIEQGFMQRDGWKGCRYLLGKLVAGKNAEIERLQVERDTLVSYWGKRILRIPCNNDGCLILEEK